MPSSIFSANTNGAYSKIKRKSELFNVCRYSHILSTPKNILSSIFDCRFNNSKAKHFLNFNIA